MLFIIQFFVIRYITTNIVDTQKHIIALPVTVPIVGNSNSNSHSQLYTIYHIIYTKDIIQGIAIANAVIKVNIEKK